MYTARQVLLFAVTAAAHRRPGSLLVVGSVPPLRERKSPLSMLSSSAPFSSSSIPQDKQQQGSSTSASAASAASPQASSSSPSSPAKPTLFSQLVANQQQKASLTTTTTTTSSSSAAQSSVPYANMPDSQKEEITKYLKQTHDRVFEHNRLWASQQSAKDPEFFAKLSAGQKPEYLWIGCADSRIPAEQITGLEPGEAFIHRNIANLVCPLDLNVMSVIEYAVRHLQVKHIVVCGHYGCGGVKAALEPKDLGVLNPWLRSIRDVYRLFEAELDAIEDPERRYDRLVELNVMEQCRSVIKTAAVQQSYARNRFPIVHGWVFGFKDGLLKDLGVDHEEMLRQVQKIYDLTGSAAAE